MQKLITTLTDSKDRELKIHIYKENGTYTYTGSNATFENLDTCLNRACKDLDVLKHMETK